MKTRYYLFVLLSVFSAAVSASALQPGKRPPPVGVSNEGELLYINNRLSYRPWNSAELPGKVRVIQHLAGRTSAEDINTPLMEALMRDESNLPRDRYQTTTIINTDDAIWGTGIFVRNLIEKNKKTYDWTQFIVDEQGDVRKAWQLHHNDSAIVLLDAQGKIQFIKEGALTPQEISFVITRIHQLVK